MSHTFSTTLTHFMLILGEICLIFFTPRFKIQKNPRVRKIRVRNSGAGNGCTIFMDAWKNCVRSAGKAMSIKFLVLGGGVFWVLGGGGVPILFLWARGFFWKIIIIKKNQAVTLCGQTARPPLSRYRVSLYLSHFNLCFSGYRAIPPPNLLYRSRRGRVAGGIAS